MNQDEASFLLAEGEAYLAKNMLFDKLGIARKRGGITGVGSTTTYDMDHIGALVTDEGLTRFYGNAPGTGFGIKPINTATGAMNTGAGIAPGGDFLQDGGRPFTHYGTLIWPAWTASQASPQDVGVVAVAGADGTVAGYTFTAPTSIVMVAGDPRVTVAVADNPLTKLQVGQFFTMPYNGFTQAYLGRIMRLVDSTHFEVFPTPSVSITGAGIISANSYNSVNPFITSNLSGQSAYIGGKVGMSYQGRVVLGNISREAQAAPIRMEHFPRRVAFSSTLLEQDAVTPLKAQGMTWLMLDGFPVLNYFDIPGQDPLSAMSPTGFGDAVIFSAFKSFRLTGNLTTQFGTEQSITWSPREIPNSVGCMSERSLQRTTRGLIFAHDSGIYTTDGQSMHPLMYRKLSNYWKTLVRAGGNNNFKIYGSALLFGNHYYICGTSDSLPWAIVVNLDTLAWGLATGKSASPASWLINSAVQDPSDPSKVWGLKWWDFVGLGGVAPSMTGGQLVRLDQMFNPSSANKNDSDTTPVSFDFIPRTYTEDDPTIQKTWLAATIEYLQTGGASIVAEPHFVLDAADVLNTTATATPLPKQDVYTVTAGTSAGVLIVLTIGAGHTITQDSWVRVTGVLGNTAANGLWRVQAVTGTTLTLMGSIGNSAYTSGGTVQCLDSLDISLQTALASIASNPVGVAYRFRDSDSLGCDKFELYGITHTYEDRDPHVE